MNRTRKIEDQPETDELRQEHDFDYSKAKPNRFASVSPPGSRVILLESDVAAVFTTPDQVNSVLRALIATMPKTA